MKYNSNFLIDSLQEDTRQIILEATKLTNLSQELLQRQPAIDIWSVAQVLEHLNIYARYYINEIERKIHLNQSGPNEEFHPGWLGNYFTKLMKPNVDNTISKKMKAPKNAIPSTQPGAKEMISEFINHQHQLLNLLEVSKSVNLDSTRIATSLSKLITLKLGDTFRFFIAHEQRHFLQIEKTLNTLQKGIKSDKPDIA